MSKVIISVYSFSRVILLVSIISNLSRFKIYIQIKHEGFVVLRLYVRAEFNSINQLFRSFTGVQDILIIEVRNISCFTISKSRCPLELMIIILIVKIDIDLDGAVI